MKVIAKVNCNGQGYEHFKAGEEREIADEVAKVLIAFDYAEEETDEETKEETKEEETDEELDKTEKPKSKKV